MNQLPVIGWREWLTLPELGVPAIKAKVDTGARTSALHVVKLQTFIEQGCLHARFLLHPVRRLPEIEIKCTAAVVDRRTVSDSGGHREKRLVIVTAVRLGDLEWPAEVTLTNREDMLFRMLLGRTALRERFAVNPGLSYRYGRKLRKIYRRRLCG